MSNIVGRTTKRRKRLALLLPSHNEEIILPSTIKSAIKAGIKKDDIYVVDDGSYDDTRKLAIKLLTRKNVLSVERSGKARAVEKAIIYFKITKKYTWLHVADADCVFCNDYFKIYKKYLNVNKVSAAVGFVQSMKGNWITLYRSFSYTYGQHIFRRIQSWVGAVAIMPGPVSCFKTDILEKLNFSSGSLTEDFDLTLQIHRKRLGKIVFISDAINYTQDPRTLRDFMKQTLRWQRGFFQGVRKHKIGFRGQLIDMTVGYQMIENTYYSIQFFVIIPVMLININNPDKLFAILWADMTLVVLLGIFSAYAARRASILLSLPYFYFLKFIEIIIYIWAFIEVFVFYKYSIKTNKWEAKGRRYKIRGADGELGGIGQMGYVSKSKSKAA